MSTLHTLRETVHTLFAQGLATVSPEQLDSLAGDLAALELAQPATLAGQMRQRMMESRPGAGEVESLIKIQQVLMQAEIRLSRAGRVDKGGLVPVRNGLYVQTPLEPLDLEAVVALPAGLVRSRAFTEWLRCAEPAQLARSLEIAWFDASLAAAVADGLAARPAEALALARTAFKHDNAVLQHTAIHMLARAGQDPAQRPAILEFLRARLKKAKPPLSFALEAGVAEIEGDLAGYRQAQQARLAAEAETLAQLRARKKGDRLKAVKALAKTKDPVFTEALLGMLDDADSDVARAVPDALVKIGAFAALPWLAERLDSQQDYSAAKALYDFGDRRALAYFISRKRLSAQEAYVPFSDFRLLAAHPLLADIRRLPAEAEKWGGFREGLLNLLESLRSNAFAAKVLEYAAEDPALAGKLAALLEFLYPAHCKRAHRLAGGQAALNELVAATLADNPQRVVL